MALTLSRNALASVRAGTLVITCKSGPHSSALGLETYILSAIGREARGMQKSTQWQTIRA